MVWETLKTFRRLLTTFKAYAEGLPLLESIELNGPTTPKITWGILLFNLFGYSNNMQKKKKKKKDSLQIIELAKS
jgi:hypothetical protein